MASAAGGIKKGADKNHPRRFFEQCHGMLIPIPLMLQYSLQYALCGSVETFTYSYSLVNGMVKGMKMREVRGEKCGRYGGNDSPLTVAFLHFFEMVSL